MRLLRKLRAILSPGAADNGSPDLSDPRMVLEATYRDLLRLAEQIQEHAERAPYPHIAARLQQIALEKRKTAKLLKEKISGSSGELTEPPLKIKSGKNHWERMVRDLEDQKAFETNLLDQTVLLASEAPEISNLLREIALGQVSHKEALLELVARADPQANLS